MTKIQEKTLMRKIRKTQKKKDQLQNQLKQEKSQQEQDVDAKSGPSELCLFLWMLIDVFCLTRV